MPVLHPLAERYLDAIYELPDALRVRKDLEEELAAAMTAGNHACIRGFWRIGKTTLMKGTLQAACARTGGAAFIVDLRDPDREDGLPQSAEAVLGRVAAKVQEFLTRVGATELKADPKAPLTVLGELAAPIFVGLDELIALRGLGAEKAGALIDGLLTTPKNVKVAAICHRHRDADALFEAHVVTRPGMACAFVPSISDDELVHIVQTPALELGVRFTDEALGALAELTGNKPWELFTLAHLAAAKLKEGFKGEITAEQVDALFDLDALGQSEEGQALVQNFLRILVTAMTPEERKLVELLAAGGEGEVPEDAVQRLEEAGWLLTGDGYALNSGLLEGIARAVAEGVIRVKVE